MWFYVPTIQSSIKTALEEGAESCASLLLVGQTFSGPEADVVDVILVWRGIEDEI